MLISVLQLLRAFNVGERSRMGLPKGIIIQSNDPEVVPHIVISPPSQSPFEMYCACGHCDFDTPCVPPQSTEYLTLPLRLDGFVRVEGMPPNADIKSSQKTVRIEVQEDLTPPRVFNRKIFEHIVSIVATFSRHPIHSSLVDL